MLKAETDGGAREGGTCYSRSRGNKAKKMSGSQALKVFYAFFPNTDSTPFWIREVVQAAGKHGVEINGTEYRLDREKGCEIGAL